MIPRLLSLVLLAALTPLASAQTVALNALVEKPTGPTACGAGLFAVSGANVFLDESLVDLDPFVGQLVRVSGKDVTPPGCPAFVVRVQSVGPATATLEVCGTPRPGCGLRFRVGPPTVSFNQLAFSVSPGFLDLGDPLGVLLLGPPIVFVSNLGGASLFDLQIPSIPALIGVPFSFQGFHLEVGPVQLPGALTNPLVVTPLALGVLCIDPTDCF